MKTDGSVIIDTKIIDGGMEKGFEAIKNEMNTVGMTAEKVGDKLRVAFSGKVSAPIENALAKVEQLGQRLEVATEGYYSAVYSDDDAGAEKWANKREILYGQLENARRKLAQVIVREADKEIRAEERAAQKALKEKERAYKKATKSARAFGKRLTSIMSGALVFSVISRGLREITKYFGNALKSNKKFSDSWNTLKGSVLTAIQPIYEILLPALITAVNVTAKLARMIGDVFAAISGKSSDQMKENAEALYEQSKAMEENGNAAKDAKKHLAGFDELNVMGSNSSEEEKSKSKFAFQDIDVDSKLSEMAKLTSEAIFALGIILTLSGVNIPLGLGMIVLGGMALYKSIKENWGGVEGNVVSTAEAIAFGVSTILLAIGIVIAFCCPTHTGLGIGLIVAGVAGLATEIPLNWNAIKEKLKNPIAAAVAAVSTALLVLGVLACFAQKWILGISLIVAGSVGLAATVGVNWNAIKEKLKGPIGAAVAVVSTAVLLLGILCCFAQKWILGIGLVVSGAAGLGITVSVNWNAIKEALQSPLGAAVGIIGGAILIVIGIFCCLAQNWILGIGLIAAGAAFLGYTTVLNWNAIKEALKGPIGGVVALVSGALLAIGAIIAFSGAGLALGIGLMAAGAVGLATTVALNWDTIVNAMQGPIGKIVAIVSGALLVLGIILLLTGVGIPLGLGLILAGAAGLATAVAFNWNSIVDWVKKAWNKVKEFWNTHIAKVFTGKFWKDLAIKCANGLIAGFEGAINGIISAFESMINWVVNGLNKISFNIPDWIPGLGGKKFGINIPEAKFGRVSIPRLAQGAVIPPNKEFMAVLGDQKHGTNIEAPLDTIKQALAEVLALQGGGGETVVSVNFTGDLAQLARVLKPAIETETRRRGGSLAKGVTF